jgi:cytosolic phospholipase A2
MKLFSADGLPRFASMRLRLRRAPTFAAFRNRRLLPRQHENGFFTSRARRRKERSALSGVPAAIVTGTLITWFMYPTEEFSKLRRAASESSKVGSGEAAEPSAWVNFTGDFEFLSSVTDIEWSKLSDKIADYVLPEWATIVPGYVRKLQTELSMAPGSLADEIWSEAHDPLVNPEIRYAANVRVSNDLCAEEKGFLSRRRMVARVALAKYLGLKERDVHPDDVPVIAMCGSGGGLRAVLAGTGSLLAAEDDGLFDCVTYTAGVSGSCWLQTLFHCSFTDGHLDKLLDHLKARTGVHIAYPPVFFQSLVQAPTSKYLLTGVVEKLRGDPKADFGLVDVYGLLLGARYLVPKGELAVNEKDFKLSNQRDYINFGQNPMPIYTAVRHEIPDLDISKDKGHQATEEAKEIAKKEAWFQWFEITPYEFFCEEFSAGIPTWAIGRKFKDGVDVPPEDGFHLPEIRLPLLMGIFGSAFCATLSHYYREVQPVVQSLTGFGAIDEMISGRNEDLSHVHPIDPATVPNFVYAMDGKLPKSTPETIYKSEYIQLMDAGMSNNLPIYPLLRPGRNVEVLIAFDASADSKSDNWLSVADGYAKQRGIKGWPVGIGWPRPGESPKQVEEELEAARAETTGEAEEKLNQAKIDQSVRRKEAGAKLNDLSSDISKSAPGPKEPDDQSQTRAKFEPGDEESGDLGYCTVWVGTTQERSSDSAPPTPSKRIDDSTAWKLTEPDAGIAIIYLPYLANDKVPTLHPGSTDFLSTWNFVYTPDQIDQVVALAKANYAEGTAQIKACVRAVYERKKKIREKAEETARRERYRGLMRKGLVHRYGEGDHFS